MIVARILASFGVTARGVPDGDLEAHVDAVADQLFEMTDLFDVSMSMDRATCIVEFDVSAKAETGGGAFDLALSCIRTAIHAAGGYTPDWPMRDRAFPGLEMEPRGEWKQLPKSELVTS